MTKLLIIAVMFSLVACSDIESAGEADLQATADAGRVTMQRAQRAQTATVAARAATSTREANTLRATSTADARATTNAQHAYSFALTATADALIVANRNAEATATADARAIHATAQAASAQATIEAIARQRLQAASDAEAARNVATFYAYAWPVVFVMCGLSLFVFALYGGTHWVNTNALRRSLMDTRAGTVFFIREAHGYTAQLLQPPAPIEHDAPTDARGVDEADVLRVNTSHGMEFIAKRDPAEERQSAMRQQVMKLLRVAISCASGDSPRIPTATEMGMSSDTRQRAVDLLVASRLVTTRVGRSGGTLLTGEWLTLAQLYAAVGEKRVQFTTPLPAERVGQGRKQTADSIV